MRSAGRSRVPAARQAQQSRLSPIAVAVVCVLCWALAGCSVGLGQLPLPAPGTGGDGFVVTAIFRNALNLPAKAKVRVKGADVGFVLDMEVRDYLAVVRMQLRDGTLLPQGTRAELRSATPLGDVFVALEPPVEPDPGGAVLQDGDTIPVESTSAGATVEEVLSTAAMLVNGGAIRNLTKLVNGLGESVGDGGDELGALIRESSTLVASLSERTAEIETVLGSANLLAATVVERQQSIDSALAAAGPALGVVADNTQAVLGMVDQLTRITRQLERFPSIHGTGAGGMVQDINEIAAWLNAAATAPGASIDDVNRILGPIIKLTSGTSGHVDVSISQFALGAFDDPNYHADPGSRLPDAGDWERFAGSLAVTMFRLQQRLEGPR